jgi:hypothetical protein
MNPSSQFEITRRDPSVNASGKYAIAAERGIALGPHATDPDSFDLAQHNSFIGFLTRRVVVGGLSITDRVFGVTSATPVGVEAPFKATEEVSLEKAKEVELEGFTYLFSGTGQILTGTTLPQNLSVKDGKWRLAQAGENVLALLTANNLPATDGVSLRIRMEMLA